MSVQHRCALGLGGGGGGGGAAQVWARHPRARYPSRAAVDAERERARREGGRLLLHPHSKAAAAHAAAGAALTLAHALTSTFRLSFVVAGGPAAADWLLLALHALCWLDVALRFNTGYEAAGEARVVLDRARVARRYARGWLAADVASSAPATLAVLAWWPGRPRLLLATLLLPLLRCARVLPACADVTVLVKAATGSHMWAACARYVLVFLVTCHWCSCVIFLPPVFSIYWHGAAAPRYASFLTDGKHFPEAIHQLSAADRYRKSVFVTLSTFFGTGFSMFTASEHDEILIHSLVILYSSLFMVYTFVFLLKMYLTVYSSNIRFHSLMNQAEEYMRHKQFPLALKRRVRSFYYYRYRERYYNEDHVLDSLSERLRAALRLAACGKLVARVPLLRGLARGAAGGAAGGALGGALGRLRAEVFLPNEFVFRAGEAGAHMLFVARGTVAVYSLRGAELCHLADGDYFGEVALLMKDRKRVATVVAVETTLLYKMDFDDFRQLVRSSDSVLERVEALATRRMHQTVLLDEDLPRSPSASSLNTKH